MASPLNGVSISSELAGGKIVGLTFVDELGGRVDVGLASGGGLRMKAVERQVLVNAYFVTISVLTLGKLGPFWFSAKEEAASFIEGLSPWFNLENMTIPIESVVVSREKLEALIANNPPLELSPQPVPDKPLG